MTPTRAELAEDLRALGVEPGQDLLVHASLHAIAGPSDRAVRAEVVADALWDVLGPGGTIVVPTATSDNSNTSREHLARTAGLSDEKRRRFLLEMPPFDPASTPSTGMGAFAEYIRTSSGAVRSAHPQTSMAALGPSAARFVDAHAQDCHYGEASPLARLYEADGWILLLGVGYAVCTAFHLAEYRYTPTPPTRIYSCVVSRGGRAQWWSYRDAVCDDCDFEQLGDVLDLRQYAKYGQVGRASARLIRFRDAVDFAVEWLAEHRKA